MRKPIVFMFSGQGSQYFQMGRELYEHHPRFRLWMDHCDTLVKDATGRSLTATLYGDHDRTERFDDILLTNPALLSIEFCLARLLREAGISPDYLLGYSLGELTSSVVADALSLEEGIRLSVEFAALLTSKSPAGGMLAILGDEGILHDHPDAFARCSISGRNFDTNFVVSGLAEEITRLQAYLDGAGVVTQRLAVNFAFHSPVVEPLKPFFLQMGGSFNFASPRIPIISAQKGHEIKRIDETHLWNVIRQPVDFKSTIRNLVARQDCIFIDVGPSGTLSTAVKYLLPKHASSIFLETLNQFCRDRASLEKTIFYLSDHMV
ncbi:acyltransferase domain-containing protein [Rhizobium sp. RCC_161_2]|uniref:acyltransferase domain-containing protein n=1 Tax=Rhizobium sp. RCC_161_2 TaxID=3239219 RepID=UPI0035239948